MLAAIKNGAQAPFLLLHGSKQAMRLLQLDTLPRTIHENRPNLTTWGSTASVRWKFRLVLLLFLLLLFWFSWLLLSLQAWQCQQQVRSMQQEALPELLALLG